MSCFSTITLLIRLIIISLILLNAYIKNAYNTIRLNSKRPKHYPLNDKRTYKFRLLQKTSFVKGLVTDKIDKSHSDNHPLPPSVVVCRSDLPSGTASTFWHQNVYQI